MFVAMAIEARSFALLAKWFPLYTGIGGAIVSVAVATLATIAVLRRQKAYERKPTLVAAVVTTGAGTASEQASDEASGVDKPNDQLTGGQQLVRGFGWLGLWLGFVALIVVVGFVAASLIWLAVWFRTAHKWPWKVLIPVLAGVFLFLYIAENHLGMAMPGGTGWIGSYFGY